jgi:MEMO1 family protein
MPLRDTINRPMHTRPCAVAGKFYPGDRDTLSRDIDRYLDAAEVQPPEPGESVDWPVRAIIVPHAGYIYSAPVAASAYRYVSAMKDSISRVVLIGPSHYVPFTGLACSSASVFETPFGDVPVDTDAMHRLVGSGYACFHDGAHAPEHGLEVHLPFLVQTLGGPNEDNTHIDGGGFSIVPLLFGDVGHEPTADMLEPFFDDLTTLIVVSSDLSHYLDYTTAKAVDRETADAISARRADAVTPYRACGHTAIRALLRCAEARGLDVDGVDLRNSGDTAGPRDKVVGYGAFIIR